MLNRNRPGFTLLEFAIVLTIMGIVGGYAAPRFAHARERASTRSAAHGVIAQISRTRDVAVRRRISTRVVIGGSTLRSYGTVGGVEQEILPPVDVSREHGALLSSPVTELRFDTRGFAAGLSGSIEIRTTRNGSSVATCVSRYGNARMGGCTT